MPIRFQDHQVPSGLRQKRALGHFLQEQIRDHRPEVKTIQIQYLFCSDEYVWKMNRQFLDHDEFTDILSFDLSETKESLEAEIYISVDRVRENALHLQAGYEQELHRVIFHGLLHLLGFGDKTPSEKSKMRMAEDQWLDNYHHQKQP